MIDSLLLDETGPKINVNVLTGEELPKIVVVSSRYRCVRR